MRSSVWLWKRRLKAFSSIFKAAALLTLGIATVLPICAQSQPSSVGHGAPYASAGPVISGASKLGFDVASVRLNTQKSVPEGVDFLNPAGDEALRRVGSFPGMCRSRG